MDIESLSPLLVSAMDSVKYYYYDMWNIHGDPRVTGYPFMDGGPWTTILLVLGYLYCVNVIGPQFMKNRKPYNLPNTILAYNTVLILLNGWFFYVGCWITNFGIDSWKCQAVDRRSRDFVDLFKIQIGWLFFMSKFVDFCDTLFFILRKKERQISGLHVFHHSVMPVFCWIGLKFVPGGNTGFFPWINSGIHTVMYTYYALSVFPEVRPYLWWKKYITQMQMVQFVLVIVHSIYSMLSPGCEWPKILMYLSIFNAFVFLALFYSFFRQTYDQKQKHHLEQQHEQQRQHQLNQHASEEDEVIDTSSSNSSIIISGTGAVKRISVTAKTSAVKVDPLEGESDEKDM